LLQKYIEIIYYKKAKYSKETCSLTENKRWHAINFWVREYSENKMTERKSHTKQLTSKKKEKRSSQATTKADEVLFKTAIFGG